MVDLTPAIFTNDENILRSQIQALSPHVPWMQLDMSDGTMVPTTSVMNAETLKGLVASYPQISFEAHLMVDNPVKYLKPLADAGFKRVIAQVEASDPRHFLDEAQLESVEVGMALDGASEVEAIEPFLESVDCAVVMTIEAGAPDSPFLPESLEKIKALRHHFPDLPIVAEGNIDERNAKILSDVGVTRLVVGAGTLLRDSNHLPQTLELLRGK